MRLWVFGDSAVMISEQGIPEDTEPLLRIARVLVKRNGQWQMVISVQTVIESLRSKKPLILVLRQRLDAELLGEFRHLAALLFDRFREIVRAADVDELPGGRQPLLDGIVGDRPDIGGNAIAKLPRHSGRAEEADQPIDGQRRIAGLL